MCEFGTDKATCMNCPETCQGRERDYQKDLEVCEKATEGPWEWTPEERGCDPETGPWGEPPSYFVHSGDFYENYKTKEKTDMLGYSAHSDADAEFIALSRTALPWYITRCMELESQLHQCREREKKMLAVVKIAEETVGQKPTCPDCKSEPACLGCDWLEGRQRLKDALAALDSEGVEEP